MKKILVAKYRRFILYFETLLLILVLVMVYNYVPLNRGSNTFYIPSSHIDDVVKTLKTSGYEVTWIDKQMLKLEKIPDEGWYSIDPAKQGRFSFFKNLHKQRSNEIMDIIVYAGETKVELTSRLARDMKLDKTKLLDQYKTLQRFKESDIFAQRYTVARKVDEYAIIQYLFLDSIRRLKKFEKEYFKQIPTMKERKRFYIIASIIQKESNSIQEMPLISSVIYNRLEKGMKLQMDSTLNYGKYAHTIVTPERIKTDKSHYNTYKHKGLPPHPLSSITIEALKAAVKPKKSDYLFFMLTKTGAHNFAATYAEHLENLSAFRAYQKEKRDENKSLKDQAFGIHFKKLKS